MLLSLALLDRKGGVGKTSLTRDLGGAYAAAGRRVLLLDLDPQASLTEGLLGPPAAEALPPRLTVAGLFDGSDPPPAALVRPTGVPGLSLVPGSAALDPFNLPCPTRTGAQQTVLRDFVAEVAGGFDVLLFDCPPNLYLCSWAALLAAGWAAIPLEPEDYGARGVVRSVEAVQAAQAVNRPLRLLGLVVNKVQPRLAVHQLYLEDLRAGYGQLVLVNQVPLSADVKAAAMCRTPLAQHKPRGAAARAVRAVADEIWLRASIATAAAAAEKGTAA